MGRRTWESLAAPLPERQNIVVTRAARLSPPPAPRSRARSTRRWRCVALPAPAFCIGGGELYAAALPRADELHLTEIAARLRRRHVVPGLRPQRLASRPRATSRRRHRYAAHRPVTFVTYAARAERRRAAHACGTVRRVVPDARVSAIMTPSPARRPPCLRRALLGRDGGTGIRSRLKICRPQGHEGSIPSPGTTTHRRPSMAIRRLHAVRLRLRAAAGPDRPDAAAERTGSRLLHVDGDDARRPPLPRPAGPAARRRPPGVERHAGRASRGSSAPSPPAAGSSSCSSACSSRRRGPVPDPCQPRPRVRGSRSSCPGAVEAAVVAARRPILPAALRRRRHRLPTASTAHGEVPLPPYITRAPTGADEAALPDRLCARTPARSPRRRRDCTSTRRCSTRCRRAGVETRVGDAARGRRNVPAGAGRRHRDAPDARRVVSDPRRDRRRGRRARAPRRPHHRRRHHQPARTRIGRVDRTGACSAGEAETALFITPRLSLPRRRPAAHQFPPAAQSTLLMLVSAFARLRAGARRLSRTRSPPATASSATATRCCSSAAPS